ncbi:MAG: polynucleotide adenylyltransferase PcnB, partial [Acidobacteriota bacterium]|nr:polynucleotide adenylyltransferase PcnB [Acidobacteriota bacterium]
MLKKILSLIRGRRQQPSASRSGHRRATADNPIRVRQPIPDRDLDSDAVKIVRRLVRHGHEAYLVGGCVRDLLLGGHPKDFDIGTSATPGQIKRLFRNSRIIGRRFRLAHIYFQDRKVIEVATFRSLEEAPSEPGKDADLLIRDDNVFGTPAEDAIRRDFTINGLFYDIDKQTVIDHTDGLEDLRRRVVRTIGDPAVRLREDPIRILRAIKFAARLNLEIETETLTAIKSYGTEIDKSAPPRVLEEIYRFCREGAAERSFVFLRGTRVLDVILPELASAYRDDEAAWKTLRHLLREIDQRPAPRIDGGESLTVLLLPLLVRPFGWGGDGTVDEGRRVDARDLANSWLDPLGRRLRLARRDQEICRLLLLSLVRMAQPRRLRPRTKQAIVRRSCFPAALGLLESMARHLGGDLTRAVEFWGRQSVPEGRRSAPPTRKETDSPAPRRRGRRGKRGGESRSKPEPEATVKQVPLDFFAALPSAPSDGASTEP